MKINSLPKLKIDKFWAIYASALILCCAAIIIWFAQLNGMLSAYEASMPRHVAADVATSLSKGEYQALYRKLDQQTAQGETEAQFASYLSSSIGGLPVSYEAAGMQSAETQRYTLSAGGKAFAELTLTQTEAADRYGNHSWAIASLTTPKQLSSTYFVTIPDESKLYVDDVVAGDDYVDESGIKLDCDGHLPKKVHTPTLTRYKITRSFSKPKFRAVDKDGTEHVLNAISDNEYEAGLNENAALKKSQGKRAVEVAKAYGMFSIGRKSKASFLQYVQSGSAAYKMIRDYDERWFVKNSGYKFKNVKAEKFYAYSKSCYSCVVTYDMVLKSGKNSQTYPTSVTLYMNKDGKFKIYDMVIGQ